MCICVKPKTFPKFNFLERPKIPENLICTHLLYFHPLLSIIIMCDDMYLLNDNSKVHDCSSVLRESLGACVTVMIIMSCCAECPTGIRPCPLWRPSLSSLQLGRFALKSNGGKKTQGQNWEMAPERFVEERGCWSLGLPACRLAFRADSSICSSGSSSTMGGGRQASAGGSSGLSLPSLVLPPVADSEKCD